MADDVSGIGRELRSLRLAQDMSGGATFVVDPDLRVVSAQGPDLLAAGIDPGDLLGRRLDDILRGPTTAPRLLGAYRSALQGDRAAMEFVDETSGRLFHVDVAPLLGPDNDVIGAVARSTDLSATRAQQTLLEHAAALHGMGVSTFDRRSGWKHDARTVELLGLDDPTLPADVIGAERVHPDDRTALGAQWSQVAREGGRLTTSYRVGDRRVQSTVEAVVGVEHVLLRAVATHVDVTAAAAASAELERVRQQVQADRLAMVRDLSGVITSSTLTIGEVLETVTDLAVTVLGGTAVFAELSDDGRTFDRCAVSDQDPQRAPAWGEAWRDPATRPTPGDASLRALVETGLPQIEGDDGGVSGPMVRVPVRHQGRVLGVFLLGRLPGTAPLVEGDVDLAQVLADRAGAAVVADRAMRAELRERDQRRETSLQLEDARDERHGLVERLSATESRERRLLAEAVHDEPIQLIAAARLRLMALERRLDKLERLEPRRRPQEAQEPVPPGVATRPTAREEAGRIGRILETATERLRMLIVALSPHDLDDGLVSALTEMAEGIFRGSPTEVRCSGPDVLPLTVLQQETSLLIAREALVNARQHACAAHVTAQVLVDETSVVLRIDDDGVGSGDIGPRKGHLGMVSMRARAEDVGGQLTVSSRVAVGTTVMLSFPLADTLPA